MSISSQFDVCSNCGNEYFRDTVCPFCEPIPPESTARVDSAAPYQLDTQPSMRDLMPTVDSKFKELTEVTSGIRGADIGFGFLSAFLPIIGIVFYIHWRNTRTTRAKVVLTGTIIGVAISLFGGAGLMQSLF